MRRRYDYMPIDAPPGTKVYFWKPENGYPGQGAACLELGLKKFAEYTVAATDIGQSYTTLFLSEFPGKRFNTTLFAIDRARHPNGGSANG